MRIKHEIININLTSVISDEPLEEVPCGSCSRCCEVLSPFLTPAEINSGRYPLSLIQPSVDELRQNPSIGPIAVLYRKLEGGCGMFIEGKCSIYDNRPLACRQFDCRKGHHPRIPNMIDDINIDI